MTLYAASYSVPGGTCLLGALGPSCLLLRIDDELALFDLAAGAISTRRAIPGLRRASPRGAWIDVDDASGPALFRGDLTGDPVRWPDAHELQLGGIVGSVAVFSDSSERMRFDLERRNVLERCPDDVEWQGVHEAAGLLLGVRERAREVVALRPTDGVIVWRARPFARKIDSLGYPQAHGDEVHVRADVLRESLIARIGVRDGEIRGVRTAPIGLDSWLPDLGAAVDERAFPYERRRTTYATTDGIVIPQDDQVIVVRASGVARVAKPTGSGALVVGSSVALIVENRSRIELVVIPLPERGDHDVEIEPRGDYATSTTGVTAVVTFAGTSAPIVIVTHPQYGRVNLTRDLSAAPPPIGARVVLDGVEVTTGGTVRVERWWIDGVREPREKERIAIGPAALVAEPQPVATRFARSLAARASREGIAIPDDVRRLVELVDRDPVFRSGLADLGLHFDEDELGLDILPELEIEGFVSIWGNGHGDGYGGLTNDGVAFLWVKDTRTPSPVGSISRYIRSRAEDAEADATAELVLGVLTREGIAS